MLTDASDGLLIADATLAVIVANPALAQLTGWPEPSLEGARLDRLLGPRTAKALAAATDVRWSDMAVSPLDPGGKPGPLCSLTASNVHLAGGEPCWLVRLTPIPPAAAPKPPAVAAEPLPLRAAETALSRLAVLAQRRGVRVGGAQVRLIGLHRARQLIGADWSRFRHRIALVAEGIIGHDLGPDDVFTTTGDGDYLVCFACADQDEADRRARRLQTRLEQRLIGNEANAGWAVAGERAALQALSVEVDATTLDLGADVEAWPSIDAITRHVRRHAEVRAAELERLIRRLDTDRGMTFAQVRTRDGTETTLLRARWPTVVDQRRLLDLARAAGREDEALLLLDGHRLDLLAAAFDRGVLDRRSVILDLQFANLDRRRNRNRLLPLLRPLVDVATTSLVANLVGVPPQAHVGRLHDALMALKPFARTLALTLPIRDLAGLAADAVPCRLFVIDAATAKTIAGTRLADRLDVRLQRAQARLLLDGSTDVALADAVGAHLLAGSS